MNSQRVFLGGGAIGHCPKRLPKGQICLFNVRFATNFKKNVLNHLLKNIQNQTLQRTGPKNLQECW